MNINPDDVQRGNAGDNQKSAQKPAQPQGADQRHITQPGVQGQPATQELRPEPEIIHLLHKRINHNQEQVSTDPPRDGTGGAESQITSPVPRAGEQGQGNQEDKQLHPEQVHSWSIHLSTLPLGPVFLRKEPDMKV